MGILSTHCQTHSLLAFFESGWASGDVFSTDLVLDSRLFFYLGLENEEAVLGHRDSD